MLQVEVEVEGSVAVLYPHDLSVLRQSFLNIPAATHSCECSQKFRETFLSQ